MALVVLAWVIAGAVARSVSIYTQANIGSSFLSDPGLGMPITSIFYIAAGTNATGDPPVSIRIAQIQNFNSTVFSPPTLTIIEHLSNFTMPSLLNMPAGVSWHELYIGEIPDTKTESLLRLGTYGTGLFLDLWLVGSQSAAKYYSLGLSDEHSLFKLALIELELDKTPGALQFNNMVERANHFYATIDAKTTRTPEEIQGRRYVMKTTTSGVIVDFEFGSTVHVTDEGIQGRGTLRNGGVPIENVLTEMNTANPFFDRTKNLQPNDDPRSIRGAVDLSLAKSKVIGIGNKVAELEITAVRQFGKLSTIATVSKTIADASVIPFLLTATIFLILDFVHQQWQVGAIGTGILIIGVTAPFLIENPIGWFIGGILALLFTLMPGLGKPTKKLPRISNTTEILQYLIWGDKDKTGNEECQKKQNATCEVSYGPGLWPAVLKKEYFDGVAFLLFANDGFPITIPDMAKAFGAVSPIDAGRNKSAPFQITCGVTKEQLTEHLGRFGKTPRYNNCDHPTIWINRTSIRIPRLNATAAQLYDRIIKGPGQGDCKILDYATNPVTIPDYGFRIKGLPVSIACGIRPISFDSDGTAISAPMVSPISFALPLPAAPAQANITETTFGPPSILQGALGNQSLLPSYESQYNNTYLNRLMTNATSQTGPNIDATSGVPFNLSSAANVTAIKSLTGFNQSTIGVLQASNASLILVPGGANPANQSTDGRAGEAYLPAPDARGFAPLSSLFASCFNHESMIKPFCLPNGTYGKQTGLFGFDTTKVSSVVSPPGTAFKLRYPVMNGRATYVASGSYTGNQTGYVPKDTLGNPRGLFSQMSRIWPYTEKSSGSLDVLINAIGPPYVCLFTGKQYTGDVLCLGLGGGNLTNMNAHISSVDILNGAVATLFPFKYGDPGSQKFTVSVPDLSSAPFGTNSNMLGRVQAVLVESSTHGVVARDLVDGNKVF